MKDSFLEKRHRYARLWHAVFSLSTVIAIVALATLLLTITNQSFGIVAIENKVDPNTLSTTPLEQLSAEALVQLARDKLNKNRVRTIERDNGPLADMDQETILKIVLENIVQPKVVKSYYLFPSLFRRADIVAEITRDHPSAVVEFRAWLNPKFLTTTMSAQPELAGVRTALLGSLYLIAITIAVAFPIGVGAAIYLEEYAERESRISRIIQTNIDNLAGVPSIVYGILG
ncbi:MAG: phosphate ABC transporter permease, partial [Anaerolineaceae bacterium]|nr:phosphate ABC transporter permease [Anaerolineaceae bacterium]